MINDEHLNLIINHLQSSFYKGTFVEIEEIPLVETIGKRFVVGQIVLNYSKDLFIIRGIYKIKRELYKTSIGIIEDSKNNLRVVYLYHYLDASQYLNNLIKKWDEQKRDTDAMIDNLISSIAEIKRRENGIL